ncbi:MAG: selenium-dependent xanthine dehydrogenase [Planctomycetota bacterium]|nr:selenium-dependent xanthine dehydrogenase [Planctomycetota bacterium]
MTQIDFTLNGSATSIDPADGESMLDALRERCGITSTKDGCQPQGRCGCCLALVNGRPVVTCAVPASRAAGKQITTLEGLDEAERAQIAQAFVDTAGLQCGFCIPGIALRAKSLLDKHPDPSRETIAKALDVHLCRCTGYTKIIDAYQHLAALRRGEPGVATGGMNAGAACDGVGARMDKYAGSELTLGSYTFVADRRPDGLLYGAVRLSDHARARVLSIDTAAALAHPGVVAVATAEDVPGNRWYGLLYDDWPGFVAVDEEVRCVGDMIAAVAAEDMATARAAAALIEVRYEELPPVTDVDAALADNAPQVNPHSPNQLSRTVVNRGQADQDLESSVHVVSGSYSTQRIEHLYLEPESALCTITEDGRLKLHSAGQGVFDDRRQVASFLGIDEEAMDVELVPSGGAFGGKEDMSIQAQAVLLSHLTGRPCRVTLSREESIRLHPKRHPMQMDYTVGCDAEGHLTAVRARIVGDTGAYASVGSKVLERAAGHACGPYRVPSVDVVSLAVRTNNPPCGAMRGFGVNQTNFAIEACLDELAEKLDIDGWEMRWRNALRVGDTFTSGQVLEKSVGLDQTLLAVKDEYKRALAAGQAVGIACGIKNSGIGNGVEEWGKARLVVEPDGTISLYNGYTEMGQGLLTVLVQFAVEVTGLPAALFHPKVDSTFALGCGQTTGSRATLFGGRAVVSASEKLRAALDAGRSLSDMVGQVFAADVVIDDTTSPNDDVAKVKTHTSFGFATQVCLLDGEGRLEKLIAAHDVGRAVNPAQCEGQIEGSIHMGLGYALSEDLLCEGGWPVTYDLRELGVLRARDMPDVEVILVEDPEPEGPFGAKGVGEIGLVPTAAAVAAALQRFDGIRRTSLPMRDSPAARALSVGHRRKH